MKKKKSEGIRNVLRSPNAVDPRHRTKEAKDLVTALFFREERRGKEENDEYFEQILKYRRSLLSPRTVPLREIEKETTKQRLHVP